MKQRDTVPSAACQLKNTGYSISENFSQAVREARGNLLVYARALEERFKLRFNKL